MPLLLLALLIVVPLVELYVIIQVGQAIGVLWTIALLLADSVLGSLLMRSQGRRAWQRFTGAMTAGRIPARETLDGALVIFGGAFLLTPGFVTDLFGFALLAPPTRALIRQLLVQRFSRLFAPAVRAGRSATGPGPFGRSDRRSPAAEGDVVESTAYDVDPPAIAPDPGE